MACSRLFKSIRRHAMKKSLRKTLFPFLAGLITLPASSVDNSGAADRAYLVQVLTRTAEPVLTAAADGKLKKRMPAPKWSGGRTNCAPLEALGRTFVGLAPWLELGPDETLEGRQRERFIDLTVRSLVNGTDPRSPDFLNFTNGNQPLVDAAFLAHGFLRSPTQVWAKLEATQRSNVVAALKSTRVIKPGENNWLLFSAMVEAALWQFTGECERPPIERAVQKHMEWYLGDGTYGDGPTFHWNYYNSYVIQPMLLEVLRVCAEQKHPLGELLPKVRARAQRYAVVQERMISPEGTFPVIGRSSAYRFGAFQHLATVALLHELPAELAPGAVRCALTAMVRRVMEAPGTYDAQGWLQVGAVGHQPSIHESYISPGSLYLCLAGLAYLGLPANDPLWTAPAQAWSQKRIWAGEDIAPDHALKEGK